MPAGWELRCRDGVLAPTMAVFTANVYSTVDNTSSTYDIDFVMQWSDDVTMESTLTDFDFGIPYEHVLTYLYPDPDVYSTVLTATFRTTSGEFPDGLANTAANYVKIEEEDCVYPYDNNSSSSSTTPAPSVMNDTDINTPTSRCTPIAPPPSAAPEPASATSSADRALPMTISSLRILVTCATTSLLLAAVITRLF